MKEYEKPEMEEYELKPEEMLANSSNCRALRGANDCTAGKLWSHDDDDPQ